MTRTTLLACLLLGSGAAAFAQSTANTVQRDINQQQRIEQGLQSGALNTREASALEREESRVNQLQTQALKDGKITPAEQAQAQCRAEQGQQRHLCRQAQQRGRQSAIGLLQAHASRCATQHQPAAAHRERRAKRLADQPRGGQARARPVQGGQGRSQRRPRRPCELPTSRRVCNGPRTTRASTSIARSTTRSRRTDPSFAFPCNGPASARAVSLSGSCGSWRSSPAAVTSDRPACARSGGAPRPRTATRHTR